MFKRAKYYVQVILINISALAIILCTNLSVLKMLLIYYHKIFLPLFVGLATIIILGDQGASGVVGIAPSSNHILIGEPSGKYNGTAFIR